MDGRELMKIEGVSDGVTDGRELELGIVEGLELVDGLELAEGLEVESVGKWRILASRQCTSVDLLPSVRRKQTFLAPRTVSPLSCGHWDGTDLDDFHWPGTSVNE